MAVLDLDHFKVVNDRYGHMIGDKVLQQLSDLLKATTREKDILVRVGGEEIVVIMPGINKKDALKIAEEFRCLICNCRLPIEGHLSASFGVAERKPSESFEKWLERADQHYMKRNKRGKTRCTLLINIRNKADVPSIFGRESVFPNKIDARGDGFAEVFSFRGEGYRLSGILFVLYNLKFVKSPPNN